MGKGGLGGGGGGSATRGCVRWQIRMSEREGARARGGLGRRRGSVTTSTIHWTIN